MGAILGYSTKTGFPNFSETLSFIEWAEGELNPRHQDFQSCALPTELSARKSKWPVNQNNHPFAEHRFDNKPCSGRDVRDSLPSLQDFRRLLSNFGTQDVKTGSIPAQILNQPCFSGYNGLIRGKWGPLGMMLAARIPAPVDSFCFLPGLPADFSPSPVAL